VVAIAGGFGWQTIAEGDPASWDLMFAVNVKAALHACQATLPSMPAAAGGAVVVKVGAPAARSGLGMGANAAAKSSPPRLT